MGHNLDINTAADGTQVTNFVTARIPAWHRLGQVFTRAMTVPEAQREAHLAGWNVRKVDVVHNAVVLGEDGVTTVTVTDDRNAMVLRDNPITGAVESLGVVGKGRPVMQNEEQGEFLEALLDLSGAEFIETAGALDGGRRVFHTAKMPQGITVGGTDHLDLNVAMLNSHDGSMALTALVTPVRIVCANTEAAAIRGAKQTWTRRNTTNIKSAMLEARRTLGLASEYGLVFAAEAERMIQTDLGFGTFMDMVDGIAEFTAPEEGALPRTVAAYKTKIEKLEELWHGPTQANIAGTHWAGYNVLTEWLDHFSPVKVKSENAEAVLMRRAENAVDKAYLSTKSGFFQTFRIPAAKDEADLITA